jgi:hypothetical protein
MPEEGIQHGESKANPILLAILLVGSGLWFHVAHGLWMILPAYGFLCVVMNVLEYLPDPDQDEKD